MTRDADDALQGEWESVESDDNESSKKQIAFTCVQLYTLCSINSSTKPLITQPTLILHILSV